MNTNELKRERISAFIDGELDDGQTEIALADLRDGDGRSDWELYHRIGDVLRSDDMALRMSDDFSARLSTRLAKEPVYIAPQVVERSSRVAPRTWRLAAGAVAVAALAFVATLPLIDALQPASSGPALAAAGPVPAETIVPVTSPEGVILRDPRIDDYLFAHQRSLPDMHQSAEYARNANFPGK